MRTRRVGWFTGVSRLVTFITVASGFVASVHAQGLAAPGGFIEPATSTALRAPVSAADAAALLPARGAFRFPAPYNTIGIRLTNAQDCGGRDCVQPVGYSYWSNINNHVGSDTMLVFLGLDRNRGGDGPTLFSVNKRTGDTRKLGPLFASTDALSWSSGEGWYFSHSRPYTLYMQRGPRLLRYDVQSRAFEIVFDVSSRFGAGRHIWQVHSSADDRVHSATLRDSTSWADLGCVAYREDQRQWYYAPAIGVYDECQVDKSGRWLVIKENVDRRNGEDNRVIDLQTGTERVLLDENGAGGHSDLGFGYMVAADNHHQQPGAIRTWWFDRDLRGGQPVASVPGQGTLVYQLTAWPTSGGRHIAHGNARAGADPSQQMACSSGASRQNLPRANEIVCYRLNGSLDALVVAPNLTSLDAAGGGADAYNKLPKGNLDPTGEYFVWTGNAGTGRLDAFIVRVPRELLGQAEIPRSAAPDAPIQLTATTGGNMAALSWRQAMGGPLPSYFAVAVGSEPGSSNLGHFNVGPATAASAAVPPGRYYARVFAVNPHGASSPSDEVTFTVDARGSPPGAPRALAATVSGAAITLSWQPPLAGGTVGTYVVQAGSASGLSDLYSGAVGTLTSLTGVVPPGTYFVRIVAQNAAGASAPSNERRVIVTSSCAAPQRPGLSTSRSGNLVSAAWSVPAGDAVTHYVLQVGRTPGSSDLANAPVGLTTSASHVMPSGTYYVRVAAVNACGASPASAEAVVQVP